MFGIFGKPKPETFAKRVEKLMRKAGIDAAITFDPEDFALNVGEGEKPRRFYLHNAYAEYCNAPWIQRRRVLNYYIAALQSPFDDIPEAFDEAKKYLLPRIQNICYNGHIRLQMRMDGEDEWKLLSKPYAEGLAVNLVFDLPNAVASVPDDRLSEWGITFDEALAVARENLLAISNEPFEKIHNGVYMATWQDTHNATRMMLHEIIWHLHVKGEYVVLIPTRNHLLVTGANDVEGLLLLGALAKAALEEEPRTLIGNAYRLKNTTWSPYLPEPDHPAYVIFKSLADLSQAEDYNQQKEMLDRVFEKEETDLFVATLMCLQKEDSIESTTLAVWSQGIETLLPKADLIAFHPEEGEDVICQWDKVIELVGSLVTTKDEYEPKRYLVDSFPDSATWPLIRENAFEME